MKIILFTLTIISLFVTSVTFVYAETDKPGIYHDKIEGDSYNYKADSVGSIALIPWEGGQNPDELTPNTAASNYFDNFNITADFYNKTTGIPSS